MELVHTKSGKRVVHEHDDNYRLEVDKTVSRFKRSNLTGGMTDHITGHIRGNEFNYAAITAPKKDKSAIMRTLKFFKSNRTAKNHSFSVPRISLFSDVETMELSNIMPKTFSKDSYLHVDQIQIYFVPTSSVYDAFATLTFNVRDDRRRSDNDIRTLEMNSNLSGVGFIDLDFSIPYKNVKDISLVVSLSQQLLKEGNEWGTMAINMAFRELTFPMQTSTNNVQGYAHLPESLMTSMMTDPTKFNSIITQEDLDELIKIDRQGDLERTFQSGSSHAKKAQYAASGMGGKPAGSDNSSIIDDIGSEGSTKDDKKMIDWIDGMRDAGSPSSSSPSSNNVLKEEGLVLKSAMKKKLETHPEESRKITFDDNVYDIMPVININPYGNSP
jgi:hypothetical protein